MPGSWNGLVFVHHTAKSNKRNNPIEAKTLPEIIVLISNLQRLLIKNGEFELKELALAV